MKRHFLTGLAITLPGLLTLSILIRLVHFLAKPFLGFTQFLLGDSFAVSFLSHFLIVIFLILSLMFVGFLAQLFILKTFFSFAEKWLYRIPFANKIYKGVQELLSGTMNKPQFSEVVLISFPYSKGKAIAFVISDATKEHKFITLFVPGAPNPMTGYMLMLPREQLTALNISKEEAMKFIASCGIVTSF